MKKIIFLIALIFSLSGPVTAKNIIISEVFYDTPLNEDNTIIPSHNGEFIEFYNIADNPVDISNWTVSVAGHGSYKFPVNTLIQPEGILVLCYQYDSSFTIKSFVDTVELDSHHQVFYHKTFILPNSAGLVSLYDSSKKLIDRIDYGQNGLEAINGFGKHISECYSLQRTNLDPYSDEGTFDSDDYETLIANPLVVPEIVNSNIADDPYEDQVEADFPNGNRAMNFVVQAVLKNKLNEGNITISPENSLLTVHYFDGLGRSLQTVRQAVTPSGEDLADFQTYDAMGRNTLNWLPIRGSGNGNFVEATQFSAKAAGFYNDSKPYSQAIYEDSPSDRVLKAFVPGSAWHNSNSSVKKEYLSNDYSNALKCINFEVTANGGIVFGGIFPPAELSVTATTDEDAKKRYEFINKDGKLVLSRQEGNNGELSDTYYIYDEYSNLRFVLPPLASDLIAQKESGETAVTDDVIQKYVFIYQYDHRNRCNRLKQSGAEWVYMVYDKTDQLIYSQDGNQRINGEWTYRMYDQLDRLAMMGVVKDGRSQEVLAKALSNSAARVKRVTSGGVYGYSNVITYASKTTIKLVNFYDDYEFIKLFKTIGPQLAYSLKSGYDEKYTNTEDGSLSAKGLLTGSMYRMLDNRNQELVKSFFYDARGRVVQSKETNQMGGYDKKYYAYTHMGKTSGYLHEHSSFKDLVNETYRYSYDHADRLTKVTHQLNNGNEVILSQYAYDDLGRVQEKKLNNNKTSVDYAYNIHNRVTGIHSDFFSQNLYYEKTPDRMEGFFNGNISGMKWKSYDGIERCYSYEYDKLDRLVTATYSESKDRENSSMFHYANQPDYSVFYQYDKQGNIERLTRYGLVSATPSWVIDPPAKQNVSVYSLATQYKYGAIDRLSYGYNGNQVTYINDEAEAPLYEGAFDFPDGTKGDSEYTFDKNGNLIKDTNKGITSMEYNLLNLPYKLVYRTGHEVEYDYDGNGTKRTVVHKFRPPVIFSPIEQTVTPLTDIDNVTVSLQIDYCGNVIYEDGEITKLLTDAGYVDLAGGSADYYYYILDYQGNNRYVFDQNGYYVESNNFYPYGMLFDEQFPSVQPYKYNGKELDRMNGLNTYDYGARQFDPASLVWTTRDPLAEKYYSISPYVYCMGNPVKYVDPDGRKIVIGTLWQRLMGALGLDTYVSKVKTQFLQNNMDSRQLESVYNKLESSDIEFKVLPISESPFKTQKKIGNHVVPDSDMERGKKQGGTIYYDPDMQTMPNGSKRTPRIGLAHEMGHLEDLMNGTVIPFDRKEIDAGNSIETYKRDLNEENPLKLENIIRGILNYESRNEYIKR